METPSLYLLTSKVQSLSCNKVRSSLFNEGFAIAFEFDLSSSLSFFFSHDCVIVVEALTNPLSLSLLVG